MKIIIDKYLDSFGYRVIINDKKVLWFDSSIFITFLTAKPKAKFRKGKLTEKYNRYVQGLESEVKRYQLIEDILNKYK